MECEAAVNSPVSVLGCQCRAAGGQTRVALFSVTDKQFVDKPTGLDFVEIGKIRSLERFQGEFLYCPHFKDFVVDEL
jgi:hypothetical protein